MSFITRCCRCSALATLAESPSRHASHLPLSFGYVYPRSNLQLLCLSLFKGKHIFFYLFFCCYYARIIQKLEFDAKFLEFKNQNIAGSCDVKPPIRLEGLAYTGSLAVTYVG